MSEFVWLVFMGWDGPDCSPSLHGAFTSLELAQEFAKKLRDKNESRHLENYAADGGTHEWKSLTSRTGYSGEEIPLPETYEEYWQSYVAFGHAFETEGFHFERREDDVIYIQKVPLNAQDFRDWP